MNGADRLKVAIRRLWPPRNFTPATLPPLDPDWQAGIESRLARIEHQQVLNRALLLTVVIALFRELGPAALKLLTDALK